MRKLGALQRKRPKLDTPVRSRGCCESRIAIASRQRRYGPRVRPLTTAARAGARLDLPPDRPRVGSGLASDALTLEYAFGASVSRYLRPPHPDPRKGSSHEEVPRDRRAGRARPCGGGRPGGARRSESGGSLRHGRRSSGRRRRRHRRGLQPDVLVLGRAVRRRHGQWQRTDRQSQVSGATTASS